MENPLGQGLRELPGPLLLTGHTGFKGTWMTLLLEHLNVPVVGYSLPAEKDSLYERAGRIGAIPELFADIRDYKALDRFIDLHKPSTIIHMAAQPLVLNSYETPRDTFDVNVMGTVNILDVAFKKEFIKAIIVVTTDKVYRNDNSGRAFIESDPLEGKDPYSASKVGTEAVVAAWQQIASVSGGPNVISVRAGNVVGGGDLGEDRLIPDLMRGVMRKQKVVIRNEASIRPWQHVLDPCRGYLAALEKAIVDNNFKHFNFGPRGAEVNVHDVALAAKRIFPTLELQFESKTSEKKMESDVLKLDSNLAQNYLNWTPSFDQEMAIEMSLLWWRLELTNQSSARDLCFEDVNKSLNQS
jgi:CDP-glucose 4,6-dehydratase